MDTAPSIEYQIKRENKRKRILSRKISSSNYYNCKSTSEYNKRQEIKHKEIINEINRLNLTSDYGV